jgi:hypothetical protein
LCVQASAGPDVDGEKFAGKRCKRAFEDVSKPILMQWTNVRILFLVTEQF